MTWPWWRPCVADLVFLLSILFAMRGSMAGGTLDDPGVGWHLRNIDAMIAQGGWLTEDPFTDPRGQTPPRWYSNQWLGEVPFYLGWHWAGLEGLGAAAALFIGLLGRWFYTSALEDGAPWPVALLWSLIGIVGTACSWIARPNLLTILFVFLTARSLLRFHENRIRWALFWLVPLFTLWANIHGGFLAGLMMIAVAFGVQLILIVGSDSEAWRRAGLLVLLGILAGLATLINPYGFELYRWIGSLLGDPFFMKLHQEWLPPDFQGEGAMRFEMLILLLPALFALGSRRPNLLEVALSVLWLHLALTGFRYVALWVAIAVPILARASLSLDPLNAWLNRVGITTNPDSLFHTPRTPSPWLWSVVIALALLGGVKAYQGRLSSHIPKIVPSHMLNRLLTHLETWEQQHNRRPVVFHDYDWGGYLTWHAWPRLLNWIDDRNEVQGKERIQAYLRASRAETGWQETLSTADWVCLKPKMPLTLALKADPATWKVVDEDEYAVIFVRQARAP